MTDTTGSPRALVVQKLQYNGASSYRWAGHVLEEDDKSVLFGAVFQYDSRDLGYVVFEKGDVFYEYYYFDRWYNVFQIYSANGALKGWYCNVTRPAEVVDGELRFVDLALDLFVYPDRRFLVLDQDEFEELSASSYSAEDVAAAKAALGDLIDRAKAGTLPGRPFDGMPAV